jgi:hypothetical protein
MRIAIMRFFMVAKNRLSVVTRSMRLPLQILGYPQRALAQLNRELRLAGELGHTPSVVHALWFAAEFYFLRRDAHSTMQILEKWPAIVSGYASTAGAANMTILRGWSQIMCDGNESGLALIREGVSRLRATGSKFYLPVSHWPRGRAKALPDELTV